VWGRRREARVARRPRGGRDPRRAGKKAPRAARPGGATMGLVCSRGRPNDVLPDGNGASTSGAGGRRRTWGDADGAVQQLQQLQQQLPAPAEQCVHSLVLRRRSLSAEGAQGARKASMAGVVAAGARAEPDGHGGDEGGGGIPTLLALAVRSIASTLESGGADMSSLDCNCQQSVFDELAAREGGVTPRTLAAFSAHALEEVALMPGPEALASGGADHWGYDAALCRQTRVLRMRAAACGALDGFRFLSCMPHLQELDLSYTRVGDADIAGLRGARALQRLALRGCGELTGTFVEALPGDALRELDLQECANFSASLHGLARLQQLAVLNLGWCRGVGVEAMWAVGQLRQLRALQLSGTDCTDAGLAHLVSSLGEGEVSSLEQLSLARCKELSDDSMKDTVSKLLRLRLLDVRWCTGIADDGFEALASLDALESLNCGGSSIDDRGLAALASVHSLRALSVDTCRLCDKGFTALHGMPNLELLSAADTFIGDAGLAALSRCPRLTSLNVSHSSQVTDIGIIHLAERATQLRCLEADTRHISNDGLEAIGKLSELTELGLFGAQVTDAGAMHLSKLSKLRRLELCGGGLSNTTCAVIGRCLRQLESLNLSNNDRVNDSGVSLLVNLTRLRVLNLTHSRISAAGVEHLAKMPSLEMLVLYECPMLGKRVVSKLVKQAMKATDTPARRRELFVKIEDA